LLGAASGDLVDIDLDSSAAVRLAKFFLPKTGAVFGRRGKPSSHWLYISNFPKTEKFVDPFEAVKQNATIVEIRSTGGQTVFPPSMHESGEAIEWVCDGKPLEVDSATLRRSVTFLASACVLARFWREGVRHDMSLAVAGALLRNGYSENEVSNLITAICTLRGDDEVEDRLQSVKTTVEKLCRDEKLQGFPTLADLTDSKLVQTLCKWLGIEKERTVQKTEYPDADSGAKPVTQTFRLTTLDDLLNEPPEEHSYVWENTLISGGFSICSAKPKVGKSTFARNLAVAIVMGTPFLGRETEKGKVIYLCLEEKRSEITNHFRQMGISGTDILIHTGPTPENALRALEIAIADAEPALVIVDPLARVLRVGDFNDYGSMSRGLEPFIDQARKSNVQILALHHEGKGEREGGDAILGSTALFGAVDCHIQMRKSKNGRTISTTQRYGEDMPETVIELDKDTGTVSDKGDLESYLVAQKKTEILDAMNDAEKITENEIKDRVGGSSKGSISKALRVLLEENQVYREGDGKKGSPFLYFKGEKPLDEMTQTEVEGGPSDSRFLGFSNSVNLENPENPDSENSNNGTDPEYYDCPFCSGQIPVAEDFCPNCKRDVIGF
jgi:DNA-binding transcriptional ArsR family regulator